MALGRMSKYILKWRDNFPNVLRSQKDSQESKYHWFIQKIFYCFLHTLSTLTSLLTLWYTDIYDFKFTKFQTCTNTSVQSLFDDTGNIP